MGNYTFEHLNSFNLKHYSQTVQTTSSVRLPMLSPPKQIPIQSLLYKLTAYLMQTATTFFDFQMKKSLSKTTTKKLYSVQECEKKHKKQCIKNIFLSDYIYSIANL